MIGFRTAVPIATAASLVFIDLNVVLVFLQSDILYFATGFELLVFVMQFVKTVLAVTLKDLREGGPALLIDLYGVDLLLLPVLLVSIYFVGPSSVASLLNQLIRGWMVGVAFFGLPYVAYRLARTMLQSGALSSVLPSGIIASEFGVLLLNASNMAAQAHTGIGGVANFAFLGRGNNLSENVGVFMSLAVVYVSLLVYALVGLDITVQISRMKALSMGAVATGAGLAWIVSFSLLSLPMSVVMVPPVFAIAGVSWWFGHGR